MDRHQHRARTHPALEDQMQLGILPLLCLSSKGEAGREWIEHVAVHRLGEAGGSVQCFQERLFKLMI